MEIRKRCGVALLLVLTWPLTARAQAVDDATRQAARNLGMSGVEAYQAQDYATASEKLEKAYRALKVPSLGLWSARALVKVDKLIEAAERYREVQRLDSVGGGRAVQEQARADAAKELEQLTPQIPSIVVELVGADLERTRVTIDGVALNTALIGEKRPVNPGRHKIEAANGDEATRRRAGTCSSRSGRRKRSRFALVRRPRARVQARRRSRNQPRPPVSASSPSPPPARVTPGGAPWRSSRSRLAARGSSWAASPARWRSAKKSQIDDNPRCRGNQCAPSESSLVDSYSALRTVSSIGFIAGAVVLSSGVVLLLTAPSDPEQTAIRVGPGSLALSRSF